MGDSSLPALSFPSESLASEFGVLNARSSASATSTLDSAFLRQVSHAAAACRGKRCGLSLMLVEVDRADEVLLTRGVTFLPQLRDECETWVDEWLHSVTEVTPLGDQRFALLLHDADRLAAARIGRRLMDAVTRSTSHEAYHWAVTLSIGIASIGLPPRNFDSRDLVQAAERCLNGAKLSGGACLKSFEVY
jgi:GGDEF domain-containing protein